MSHFYYLYPTIKFQKIENKDKEQFDELELKNCFVFYLSKESKKFDNILDTSSPHFVLWNNSHISMIRDNVLDTLLSLTSNVLQDKNLAEEAELIKKLNKMLRNGINVISSDRTKEINLILKSTYKSYVEQLIIDCLEKKIRGRTNNRYILIQEMSHIYIELMKAFNTASMNKSVIYISVN